MFTRSLTLVLVGLAVSVSAIGVRDEPTGQFEMDFKGKKSPAQVMIDTLGKVVLDMRRDQEKDTETFRHIKARCASEIRNATLIMNEDVSDLKSATAKVKEDLAAVGNSAKLVTIQRHKCDALRQVMFRVNQTLSLLKQQRVHEEAQHTVHEAFVRDNHRMLNKLENYIKKGAAELAAKMEGKKLSSFLEVRSRGTTHMSKLWKRLHAHVKQAMKPEKFPQENDPATKVNEKPKVVKGAKTTGMPEGMQEIMDEIKGELDVASKEHAKQLIESKGLYEKELQRLELEFSMSESQLLKQEEKLEDMKKTHKRAMMALNALNTGSGDWSYRLIAENAKAAVDATSLQCQKFEEAYHARTSHRESDELATKAVVKTIKELFHNIVGKAKGF